MSGEGGIIDLRSRLAAVEPLAQAAVTEADVLALIAASDISAGAGLLRVGNEIRLAIGTLPQAG
jgi:hypothetical protein